MSCYCIHNKFNQCRTQDFFQIDRDCFSHCDMAKIHIHETGKLFEQLLHNYWHIIEVGQECLWNVLSDRLTLRIVSRVDVTSHMSHDMWNSTLGLGVTKWSRVWTPDQCGSKRQRKIKRVNKNIRKGMKESTDSRFVPNFKKGIQGSTNGRICPNFLLARTRPTAQHSTGLAFPFLNSDQIGGPRIPALPFKNFDRFVRPSAPLKFRTDLAVRGSLPY